MDYVEQGCRNNAGAGIASKIRVCIWPIASLRCYATIRRLSRHSGLRQGVSPAELWVHGLTLLWQIVRFARFLGFPNRFFNDSWVVGSRRADHGGMGRRTRTLAEAFPGSVGS